MRFPRQIDEEFADRLNRFSNILAAVLDAAEANYAASISALDGLLEKPAPSQQLEGILKCERRLGQNGREGSQ